jgi:hypothetical protein
MKSFNPRGKVRGILIQKTTIMIDKFSNEDLALANFRLSLENNALLEIVLSNQIDIMRKLDIPIVFKNDLVQRAVPGYKNPNPDSDLQKLLKDAGAITSVTAIRLYHFVHEVNKAKREGDNYVNS